MNQKGFTLVEALISVAIVGVLAVIAVPVYQTKLVKAQTSEAMSSMEAQKNRVLSNIVKYGDCLGKGEPIASLKYGSLTTQGVISANVLTHPNAQVKTGCTLTYIFANSGVSKRLQGKKIVVDIFGNGILSKNTATNLGVDYIPHTLTTLAEDTLADKEVLVVGNVDIAKDTEVIGVPSGQVEDPVSLNPVMRSLRYCTSSTSSSGGIATYVCYYVSKDTGKVFLTLGHSNGKEGPLSGAIETVVWQETKLINDYENGCNASICTKVDLDPSAYYFTHNDGSVYIKSSYWSIVRFKSAAWGGFNPTSNWMTSTVVTDMETNTKLATYKVW